MIPYICYSDQCFTWKVQFSQTITNSSQSLNNNKNVNFAAVVFGDKEHCKPPQQDPRPILLYFTSR